VEIAPPSRRRVLKESYVSADGQPVPGAPGPARAPAFVSGEGVTRDGEEASAGAAGPEEAAGDGRAGRPQKGKYQHKAAKRPPKRVRRVITRANPEVLRKLEELKETERRLFPEAAAGRERREAAEESERLREQAKSAAKKSAPLSRKAKRDLRKYGVTSAGGAKPYSSRKLLNFRMLFAETPIEEAGDVEIADNMRLLFLAHADHNMPDTLEKFVAYLRNSLCSGISGEQLERVMDILVRYGIVAVSGNRITVTVE
jgi:hypothetical protein